LSASSARGGQIADGDVPSPPIISTAGFCPAASADMMDKAQVCAAGSLRVGSLEELFKSLCVESCVL
jgi:hypothetical protein